MLLGWPGVGLLAVTTVADDRGRRAGYARYAFDTVGERAYNGLTTAYLYA